MAQSPQARSQEIEANRMSLPINIVQHLSTAISWRARFTLQSKEQCIAPAIPARLTRLRIGQANYCQKPVSHVPHCSWKQPERQPRAFLGRCKEASMGTSSLSPAIVTGKQNGACPLSGEAPGGNAKARCAAVGISTSTGSIRTNAPNSFFAEKDLM